MSHVFIIRVHVRRMENSIMPDSMSDAYASCYAASANYEEAVKIHLLQIMILRNDSENEAHKLFGAPNAGVRYGNEADLVVQFIHVAGVFIKIDDIAENIFDFGIDLIQ